MRLTEEQFKALVGKKNALVSKKERKVVIANGYRSHKQGERTIGLKTYYFRSLWEMNFARYLEWLRSTNNIIDWSYEEVKFDFSEGNYKTPPFSYLPDFKIVNKDSSTEFYEVKGYMTASSRKKLTRLEKHYPDIKITVIDKKWFSKNNGKLKKLISSWETLNE